MEKQEKEERNKILAQMFLWLSECYTARFNEDLCRIEINKTVLDTVLKIHIRIVDDLNARITAEYTPSLPKGGSAENIEYWLHRVLARANFCEEVNDEGEKYIAISKDFQLSVSQIEDDVRLLRMILDVCREYKNYYEEDIDCADELELKFRSQGVVSLASSHSPRTRPPIIEGQNSVS